MKINVVLVIVGVILTSVGGSLAIHYFPANLPFSIVGGALIGIAVVRGR